jgi:hypothetical protein
MGTIFANHPTAAYVYKVREARVLDPGTVLLRAVAGMVPPGKKILDPSKNAIQSLVAVEEDGVWLNIGETAYDRIDQCVILVTEFVSDQIPVRPQAFAPLRNLNGSQEAIGPRHRLHLDRPPSGARS